MISKDKLKHFLDYLNENGLYQIEDNRELLRIYPKIIQYYTTKVKSDFVSNILQIKSLSKNKDLKNRFVGDCKFSKSIKRSCLELRDKKILALLKDYEFMLKGSLKYVEEMYKELKREKITDEDYLGMSRDSVEEMYEYFKNGSNDNKNDGSTNDVIDVRKVKVNEAEGQVHEANDKDIREVNVHEVNDKDIREVNDKKVRKSKRSKQDKNLTEQNDSMKINKESFKECLNEIMNSVTPTTPKKINFANLLIYSRFN